MEKYFILSNLMKTIEDRKTKPKESSYVAALMHKGENKIKDKIREESLEVIEAAREEPNDHLVYELADLFFHTLVLLGYKNIKLENVFNFDIDDIKKYSDKDNISIIDDKLIKEINKLFSSQVAHLDMLTKSITNIILYALIIANYYSLSISDIENELARREGLSGLTEKASRNKK